MAWVRYTLGLLISLLLAMPSFAADISSIHTQMAAGHYEAAYIEANELETSEGYALAAEVLLTEIMLGQAEKNKKHAKRARKRAKSSLELDPENKHARLQYAIADGFVTREAGDVSAWMKKLPQKTRKIIEAYQGDYPEDPRGKALMGAWHLAVVRKAGDKNAQKWFDASIADGRNLFLDARSTQPTDIIIGINYAFSLLALDPEDFPDSEEARRVLSLMVQLKPQDHLGQTLQSYGKEALNRIDDRAAVSEYVGMFLDGKVPE